MQDEEGGAGRGGAGRGGGREMGFTVRIKEKGVGGDRLQGERRKLRKEMGKGF